MITKKDRQLLIQDMKEVFASKDDLVHSLKPIKKSLKEIKSNLDLTIRTFDNGFNYHHRRLSNLEEKAGVKPPDFVPLSN